MRTLLALAVFAFAAVGCCCEGTKGVLSTYDGPEPPEEEIAILVSDSHGTSVLLGQSIQIVSVDGRELGHFNTASSARLSPGRHCIRVDLETRLFYGMGGVRPCFFSTQFEAGHRYRPVTPFPNWTHFEMETTYRGVVTTQTIRCTELCSPESATGRRR
jgi:hypothetical protein